MAAKKTTAGTVGLGKKPLTNTQWQNGDLVASMLGNDPVKIARAYGANPIPGLLANGKPVTGNDYLNGVFANAMVPGTVPKLAAPASASLGVGAGFVANTLATPAAAGSAPPAPAPVDPFFTADDLDAINAFTTDLQTKLTSIDTGLANAETDTTYQKTQTETAAKQNSSAATDNAIERGIFQSSIKDADLYDIEASRSLAQKFLDNKLTTARLDAGTNKQILSTAKTNFDTNMEKRKVQNAQGVNDANSSGWAAAMAAWSAAQPKITPTGPAPATPALAPKPAAPKPKAATPSNTLFAATPTNKPATNNPARPNTASGVGSTKKARTKTTTVYGDRSGP